MIMSDELKTEPKPVAGLVDAATLVQLIWANSAKKPCTESIMRRARARQIPSVRFGRNVFFSPPAVLAAIEKKLTLQAR